MIDISIAFHIMQNITKAITIQETLEAHSIISLLTHSHLKLAMDILYQAQISTVEFESLLADAIEEFTRAIDLEKETNNLIIAYLGLALCYKLIDDNNNIKRVLGRLLEDNLCWSELNSNRDFASRPYEPSPLTMVEGGAKVEPFRRAWHRKLQDMLKLEKQIKEAIEKL